MSYGSSVGQLQSPVAIKRLKKKIQDFKFISVRERATVLQLRESGLDKVIHVLDPVFLHDKTYYVNPYFQNKFGKYILVYAVHSDPFLELVVSKIAKRLNAKIILVGGFIQKIHHDYYLRNIGPCEFVNLINNASYVVANSFHATAFSILLNRQFSLVNPKASPLRLSDFLSTVGLENRLIFSESDIEKVMENINYEKVNQVIKKLQDESRKYLLDSLQFFSNEV